MVYVDKIASQAAEIRLVQVVLSVIAAPFYVVGFVAAVLWLAVVWIVAAVKVGFEDVAASRRGAVADGGE